MKNSKAVLNGSGKMFVNALKGLGSTGLNLVKITAEVGTAVVLGTVAVGCIVVETVADGASKVTEKVAASSAARQAKRSDAEVEALLEVLKRLQYPATTSVPFVPTSTVPVVEEKLQGNFTIING